KGYPYPEKDNAATDADGQFEVATLPAPGTYWLDIFSGDRKLGGQAQVVVEKWTGVTHVLVLDPLKLAATGTVRGRLVSDGNPLAGVAFNAERQFALGQGQETIPLTQMATDSDVKFTLQTLPNETVMVRVFQLGFLALNSRQFQ